MGKDDLVVILGDFGLLWWPEPDGEERWWTRNLTERRFTTLFLDGNHENHDRLDALPRAHRFGGEVGVVNDSIMHLRRGEIYDLAGRVCLVLGGAASHDRAYRKEGVSWWPQEVLSEQDADRGLRAAARVNNSVDHVLTHTCPSSILPEMIQAVKASDPRASFDGPADPSHAILDRVQQAVTFRSWHFGHFHVDCTVKQRYHCHFNQPPVALTAQNDRSA